MSGKAESWLSREVPSKSGQIVMCMGIQTGWYEMFEIDNDNDQRKLEIQACYTCVYIIDLRSLPISRIRHRYGHE